MKKYYQIVLVSLLLGVYSFGKVAPAEGLHLPFEPLQVHSQKSFLDPDKIHIAQHGDQTEFLTFSSDSFPSYSDDQPVGAVFLANSQELLSLRLHEYSIINGTSVDLHFGISDIIFPFHYHW